MSTKSLCVVCQLTFYALIALTVVGLVVHAWSYMVAMLVLVATLFVWSTMGYLTASLEKKVEAVVVSQKCAPLP